MKSILCATDKKTALFAETLGLRSNTPIYKHRFCLELLSLNIGPRDLRDGEPYMMFNLLNGPFESCRQIGDCPMRLWRHKLGSFIHLVQGH